MMIIGVDPSQRRESERERERGEESIAVWFTFSPLAISSPRDNVLHSPPMCVYTWAAHDNSHTSPLTRIEILPDGKERQ
jgi:hypothetical protein